jgi:hypothetical protein
MLAALDRLAGEIRVDFAEASSFVDAYGRDPTSYCDSLLATKICLAPRGGSVETFRIFEGAAAGCVVITEPLPPAWFYSEFPRRELRSWAELPAAVEELLSQPAVMQALSDATRRWADEIVSPSAVGRWVAEQLDRGER